MTTDSQPCAPGREACRHGAGAVFSCEPSGRGRGGSPSSSGSEANAPTIAPRILWPDQRANESTRSARKKEIVGKKKAPLGRRLHSTHAGRHRRRQVRRHQRRGCSAARVLKWGGGGGRRRTHGLGSLGGPGGNESWARTTERKPLLRWGQVRASSRAKSSLQRGAELGVASTMGRGKVDKAKSRKDEKFYRAAKVSTLRRVRGPGE